MAFNFQNIGGLEKQKDFGDILKQGNELYQSNYKFQKTKALNDLFSKHVKQDGTLDDVAFYRDAKAAGIGSDMITEALANKTKQSEAAVTEAENAAQLEMMGRSPDIQRAFNQPGHTAQEDKAPTTREWLGQKPKDWLTPKDTPIAKQEKTLLDELAAYDNEYKQKVIAESKDQPLDQKIKTVLKYTENPEGKKIETPIVQVQAPKGYTSEDEYNKSEAKKIHNLSYDEYQESKIPVSQQLDRMFKPQAQTSTKTVDKEMDLGSGVVTGTVEKPKTYSAVEEMLRKKETKDETGAGDYTKVANPYKLENMGRYKGYAIDYLSKTGLSVDQAGLDQAHQIYIDGVPKPTKKKDKDGKIDRLGYLADIERWKADAQKSSAQFMKDLIAGNTTAISEKVAQANLKMAKEKRVEEREQNEADILGRRTGGSVDNFRPVSKEEATKGRIMAEAYRDLGASKNIPDTFPRAMQAAAAKLKGNTVPVTMDNLVAELVAQGAVPSKTAITIKSLLSNGATLTDLASKYLVETGSPLVIDKQRIDAYIDQNLADMTAGLKAVGFNAPKIEKTKEPTPAAKFAGDRPSDKSKTAVVRKNGDTWSDANYNYRMMNGQVQRKRK